MKQASSENELLGKLASSGSALQAGFIGRRAFWKPDFWRREHFGKQRFGEGFFGKLTIFGTISFSVLEWYVREMACLRGNG